MAYNFETDTFAFIYTIVASLLGVSYPLIVQSINTLDKKYEVSLLTDFFRRERAFNIYKLLLPIVAFLTFLLAFILPQCNFSIYVVVAIVAESILLLGLVCFFIYLLYVIQIYYNPDKIARWVLGEIPDQSAACKSLDGKNPYYEKLLLAVELMKYSSRNSNEKMYKYCRKYFLLGVASEIPKNAGPIKECFYDNDTLELILRLTKYSKDKTLLPLSYNNILADVMYFYPSILKYYLGDKHLRTLWRAIYEMAQSSNAEWFKQYWMQALQYYTFVIHQDPNTFIHTAKGVQIRKRYIEHHFMIGAILLQSKQYEWINFMLTSDHISPPNFYLIPGSLPSVYDVLIDLNNLLETPRLLTSRYQMIDSFHTHSSDDQIMTWAYRYAALLIVRICLLKAQTNNIPLSHQANDSIKLTRNISNLQKYSDLTNKLIEELNGYYNRNEILSKIDYLSSLTTNAAVELLNELENQINDKITEATDNPTVDPSKLVGLKEELCKEDENQNNIKKDFDVYNDASIEGDRSIKQLITVPATIHKMQCTKEYQYTWSNFPEVVIRFLYDNVASYICRGLANLKITNDIIANESTLFKILDSLNITGEYVIVSFGVMLDVIDKMYNKERKLVDEPNFKCSYNGAPILQYGIYDSTMYILKKSDLPKIDFLSADEDETIGVSKLSEIDETNHLISNIDSHIKYYSTSQNMPFESAELIVGKLVGLSYKKDSCCIRIKVSNSNDIDLND